MEIELNSDTVSAAIEVLNAVGGLLDGAPESKEAVYMGITLSNAAAYLVEMLCAMAHGADVSAAIQAAMRGELKLG